MNSSPNLRLSRPRFALLVFAAVYPLLTALLYGLAPLLIHLATWQRSLIICPIIVVAMVWAIIPTIQRAFGKFINFTHTNTLKKKGNST